MAFASRVQRALQIPIGIIDNARGGASIESLVPRHKFDDDPLAARYLAWVEKRRAEFDWDAAIISPAHIESAFADARSAAGSRRFASCTPYPTQRLIVAT